jgi:hypothetical protein
MKLTCTFKPYKPYYCISNGRLDEIKSFVTTDGLTDRFKRTFARLENYSANDCEVNLYSDFAPLSLL